MTWFICQLKTYLFHLVCLERLRLSSLGLIKLLSVSYKLALPSDLGKLHPVFHVSLLKPAFGNLPVPRAPVFSADSDTFEVEKILAKRLSHGGVKYLVMWKGYNLWDATWEPITNLTDC